MANTPIAFSPGAVASARLTYAKKGFEATLWNQYVGKQYMSNEGLEAHSYRHTILSMREPLIHGVAMIDSAHWVLLSSETLAIHLMLPTDTCGEILRITMLRQPSI